MKLVLAILCGLMLTATPFLSPAAAPCVKEVKACCSHGNPMPCCAAQDNPAPQKTPVVPQSAAQNQFSLLLTLSAITWTLPETPANAISPATIFSPSAVAAPLFVRHCAFLI